MFPQAQDTSSNMSLADAAVAAANARQWLQKQNAGRSSGHESTKREKFLSVWLKNNSFSQTALKISASTHARMAGRSTMGTATTGAPATIPRTGLLPRTSAGNREVTWPPWSMPLSKITSRGRWQKMDMTQFGSEETTLRRTLRGSGPTALLETPPFGLQPSQTTLSTKTVSLLLDYPGDNNDWRYNRK